MKGLVYVNVRAQYWNGHTNLPPTSYHALPRRRITQKFQRTVGAPLLDGQSPPAELTAECSLRGDLSPQTDLTASRFWLCSILDVLVSIRPHSSRSLPPPEVPLCVFLSFSPGQSQPGGERTLWKVAHSASSLVSLVTNVSRRVKCPWSKRAAARDGRRSSRGLTRQPARQAANEGAGPGGKRLSHVLASRNCSRRLWQEDRQKTNTHVPRIEPPVTEITPVSNDTLSPSELLPRVQTKPVWKNAAL